MEQDIERMEVFSRQANLKFIGIREDNLDGVSSVDKVVHLLNNHLSNSNWRHSDIQAYRLGRWYPKGSPRPLIVSFRQRTSCRYYAISVSEQTSDDWG
jgi:hypothetical protein